MAETREVLHELGKLIEEGTPIYLEEVERVDGDVITIAFNGMKFTYTKPRGIGKNSGKLSVKLDLDATGVITGLKAIQREAREATKTLRDLESSQKAVKAVE